MPGNEVAGQREVQSGQAVVEFALILPLLVALLLGIVDLGRVFHTYMALANAAREGARYCALHPGDTNGTRARIVSELDGRISADTSATVCQDEATGATDTAGGVAVTVAVAARFEPITPFIRNIASGPFNVWAPATMVIWR